MSLPAFGVNRPVVANLVMLALVVGGLIFGTGIRREFFPETDPTIVMVVAPYPGAAPDEVERALASKIEDQIRDLRDIKEIASTVSESMASIRIEFESYKDIDAAVAEVKREVDSLQDLPDAAERIVVQKLEPNLPAIILSLYGDADERTMKRAIREIRDDLRTIPGMGQIVVSGARVDEITVEVRPEATLQHGLSLPAIAGRIRGAMIETPGGAVRSLTENIGLRTPGIDERAEDIGDIVVKAEDVGQRVRLRDVADVSYGFQDVDLAERLNGKPSVSLTVYQVADQDAVEIASLVKAYAAGLRREPYERSVGDKLGGLFAQPGTVSPKDQAHRLGLERVARAELPGEVAITTDLARFIVGRLNLLTRNAAWGACLVFIVLFVFLNWRVSFWVLAGMMIALMGTLVFMRLTGITLNLLTMFGLIIVVGILVDDAIVVAENIVARHEQGLTPKLAAIRGANQVAWPVVGTVVTTIFAFLPLSMIDGQMGDLMEALPVVVAVALAVSLIESLFILPVHMAHSLSGADRREESHKQGVFERVEQRFDRARDGFFTRILMPNYTSVLRLALRYRYLSICTALAIVIGSVGMVAGGRVGFAFLTSSDAETISGELRMPIGTPASVTDQYVRRLEAACADMPEIQSVFAIVGSVASLEGDGSSSAPHLAQIIIELTPVEERTDKGQRRSDQVIIALRESLEGQLVGIKSFRMEEMQGGAAGPPISLGVAGEDPVLLDAAVADIEAMLNGFESVYDVSNDADAGQQELRFHLREGASELGFTVANVAEQVRGAVYGLEPFTFAGDEEDVDVRVLFPEQFRRDLASLETMHLFTPMGDPVPLPEVVRIEQAESYATVKRVDGKRLVLITGDANDDEISPDEITANVLARRAEIEARYPGVSLIERGRSKEMKDSFSTLPLGFLTAIGLIYLCLAWLFQSYVQPLIVLAAVPFAIIGVIWGHYLLGFRLTFLSMIGFIALAGIVVNDSLIFVQFFNRVRAAGLDVYAACIATGRARLRAILLTTITTVSGLLPMLLERSFQARFLIPMAITISFGLISATVLVLILLPSLLMIFADLKRLVRVMWTGEYEPPIPHVEPDDLDTYMKLDVHGGTASTDEPT